MEIEESSKRKRYELIDIFKFICAIFVVGIHSEIIKDPNIDANWYILNMVFRIAVPFFFVTSGFLFGKKYYKDEENLKNITKKQIKGLAIPFVFWMLVSLPYNIITYKGGNLTKFLIQRTIFYPWGAMWYVLALIIAIQISYIFLKYNKLKIAIIFSLIFFLIALIGNSYYFVIDGTQIHKMIDKYIDLFVSFRNGIFVGFPLFTFGLYFTQFEEKVRKSKKCLIYVTLIILLLLQTCEVTLIRNKHYIDDHGYYLTTAPIALCILSICVKNKNIHISILNTEILRDISVGMYFMHSPILNYTKLIDKDINKWAMFIGTVTITILISLLFYKIKVLLKEKNSPNN